MDGIERVDKATGGKVILNTAPGINNWNLFVPQKFADEYPNWDASVSNKADALFALHVITVEGEGFPCTEAQCDTDANKNAHFYRFYQMYIQLLEQEIKSAKDRDMRSPPWTPCYPVIPNPSQNGVQEGSHLILEAHSLKVLKLFNASYSAMLQMLTYAWTTSLPGQNMRLGKIFNLAIDLMLGVMKPLGENLCSSHSGYKGFTAGPSFECFEKLGAIPSGEVAKKYFTEQIQNLYDTSKALFPGGKVTACLETILHKLVEWGLNYEAPTCPVQVPPGPQLVMVGTEPKKAGKEAKVSKDATEGKK
jgi:hypothetical protein